MKSVCLLHTLSILDVIQNNTICIVNSRCNRSYTVQCVCESSIKANNNSSNHNNNNKPKQASKQHSLGRFRCVKKTREARERTRGREPCGRSEGERMRLEVHRLPLGLGNHGGAGSEVLTGLHWSEMLQPQRGVGKRTTPVRVVWSVPEPESGGLTPACWVGLDDGRVACVGRDGILLGVWACALAASSVASGTKPSTSAGPSRVLVEAPVGGGARVAGRANELMFFHAHSRKLLFAHFPELMVDPKPAHVFCVYECESEVTSVYASDEGDFVVVGDASGSLHGIEVESGALIGIAEGAHTGPIDAVKGRVGSPPVIASCCATDGSVAVWRIALNQFQCLFRTQNSAVPMSVSAMALGAVVGGLGKDTVSFNTEANKGSILAIATPSGSVLLWSSGPNNDWTKLPPIDTRTTGGKAAGKKEAISSLAIDYESALLAVGCASGLMKIFDVLTASLLTTIHPQPHAPAVTGSVVDCAVSHDALNGSFITHCSRQGPPQFEAIDRLREMKDKKLKTTVHPIVPREPFPEVPSLIHLRKINVRTLPSAASAGERRQRRDHPEAGPSALETDMETRMEQGHISDTGNGAFKQGTTNESSESSGAHKGTSSAPPLATVGDHPNADTGRAAVPSSSLMETDKGDGGGEALRTSRDGINGGDNDEGDDDDDDDDDVESVGKMLEREFESLSEDLRRLKETKEKMRDLQRLATLQQKRVDGMADSGLHGAGGYEMGDDSYAPAASGRVSIPHLESSALSAPVLNSTARTIGKANELTREFVMDTSKQKRQLEDLIALERKFQEACLEVKSIDIPLTKIDDRVEEYVPKKVGKQLDPRWVAAHSNRPVMGDFWTKDMHEPQVCRIEPVPYKPPPSFYELAGGMNPSYTV